ncbi:hypothetical protein ACFVZD_42445 [Streptomyces sp. NPDC058287]|uniref:hypothetical protein n=1 Tax=unclassified Streptomyces TaxID=2593676 RepID=UPI0036E0607B
MTFSAGAPPDSVIPLAAEDQHPGFAWADGVVLRRRGRRPAHGRHPAYRRTRRGGPLRVRRDGDRIRVTTDSPHAWHLRVGGPDGILHTVEPGPGVTEIPCGD